MVGSKESCVKEFIGAVFFLLTFLRTNNTKVISLITNDLVNKFGNNTTESGHISIEKQLKTLPVKSYKKAQLSICSNATIMNVYSTGHNLV